MDRCQQAALVAARQAWVDAGAPEVDPIRLAVVIGTGIGGVRTLLEQDDVVTGPDPTGAGQLRAMLNAVTDAGLRPSEVDHVNCHRDVHCRRRRGRGCRHPAGAGRGHRCSPHPSPGLGHLVGAAGAVEAIITVLSMAEGVIPPTLNLHQKAPKVELDVVTGGPREQRLGAALCNSFGFGRQNVSLLFTAP